MDQEFEATVLDSLSTVGCGGLRMRLVVWYNITILTPESRPTLLYITSNVNEDP